MEEEVSVKRLLARIKQYYDILPPKTTSLDREGFNDTILEVSEKLESSQRKLTNRIQEKQSELMLVKKERDLKIRDWKDRYDKLFYRWKECLRQLDRLQKESEKIRSHRDRLLLSTTSQKSYESFEDENEKRKNERRKIRKFFIDQVLFELLSTVTMNFNCEMGSIFVSTKRRRFLTTLVCVNNTISKDKQLNIKIEIPSNKGIAGYVFRHREAVNVLNPYQDKRFYRKVDRELGNVTKVLLCFPLLSPVTNETMGVIQVLNKKDDNQFNLRDEEKMNELSQLFSVILDHTSWLFKNCYKNELSMLDGNSTGGTPRGNNSSFFGAAKDNNKLKAKIRRQNTQIAITRIGKADNKQTQGGFGDISHLKSLVPKQVEDFVLKLNQCWKRAVKESSELQNEKELLEKELEQHEKELVIIKTELKSYKNSLEDTMEKMKIQMEEFKGKRKLWYEEKKKMTKEVDKLRMLYSRLSHPSMQLNAGLTGLGGFGQEESKKKRGMLGKMRRSFDGIEGIMNRQKSLTMLAELTNNKRMSVPEKSDVMSLCLPNINNSPKFSRKKKGSGNGRSKKRKSIMCYTCKLKAIPKYPDIFELSFASAPCSMLLLSNRYRIWRTNRKFDDLISVKEGDLIGVVLSDICVGVDVESLPRLLKFDVVQGLGLSLPKSKEVLKVTMQVSTFGIEGTRMQNINKKTVRAPMFCLVFYRQKED